MQSQSRSGKCVRRFLVFVIICKGRCSYEKWRHGRHFVRKESTRMLVPSRCLSRLVAAPSGLSQLVSARRGLSQLAVACRDSSRLVMAYRRLSRLVSACRCLSRPATNNRPSKRRHVNFCRFRKRRDKSQVIVTQKHTIQNGRSQGHFLSFLALCGLLGIFDAFQICMVS